MQTIKQMIPDRVKKHVKKRLRPILTWPYQQATSRSRALPDFIIIGAMKSGTGSLFYHLAQHPQILTPSRKEVHYFDCPDIFAKGEFWYRAHFPLSRKLNIGFKTFEASPRYIYDPNTPKRIFNLIPEVKIIAVLRNPTERAISHYFQEKRAKRETLAIYEAMQEEEKRLEESIKTKNYYSRSFVHYSYKRRGLYKEQVERYLNYFPLRQILILSSEELFSEPEFCFRRIFDFVGLDAEYKVNNIERRNAASNRCEVDSSVYKYLNKYFAPHNQELYKLVGKDYGW